MRLTVMLTRHCRTSRRRTRLRSADKPTVRLKPPVRKAVASQRSWWSVLQEKLHCDIATDLHSMRSGMLLKSFTLAAWLNRSSHTLGLNGYVSIRCSPRPSVIISIACKLWSSKGLTDCSTHQPFCLQSSARSFRRSFVAITSTWRIRQTTNHRSQNN